MTDNVVILGTHDSARSVRGEGLRRMPQLPLETMRSAELQSARNRIAEA